MCNEIIWCRRTCWSITAPRQHWETDWNMMEPLVLFAHGIECWWWPRVGLSAMGVNVCMMNHLCRGVKGVVISWVRVEFKTYEILWVFQQFLYHNSFSLWISCRLHSFWADYADLEPASHVVPFMFSPRTDILSSTLLVRESAEILRENENPDCAIQIIRNCSFLSVFFSNEPEQNITC